MAIVIIRGNRAPRKPRSSVNFWVDMTALDALGSCCRSAWGGLTGCSSLKESCRNLKPYNHRPARRTADGTGDRRGRKGNRPQVVREQVIAQGPVASQELIKELGHKWGAASSMQTARTLLKILLHFRTFSKLVADLRDHPRASLTHWGRMTGSSAARLGPCGPRWWCCFFFCWA